MKIIHIILTGLFAALAIGVRRFEADPGAEVTFTEEEVQAYFTAQAGGCGTLTYCGEGADLDNPDGPGTIKYATGSDGLEGEARAAVFHPTGVIEDRLLNAHEVALILQHCADNPPSGSGSGA